MIEIDAIGIANITNEKMLIAYPRPLIVVKTNKIPACTTDRFCP
jgi:hypothetical protein